MKELTKIGEDGVVDSLPQSHVRFLNRLRESMTALKSMINRGYDHWIVTFSGGKDSTT